MVKKLLEKYILTVEYSVRKIESYYKILSTNSLDSHAERNGCGVPPYPNTKIYQFNSIIFEI